MRGEIPHNADTNSVILSESERSHRRGDFPNSAILRCTQKDETKPVIVSESETIQPIVNQKQLQGKKYAPTSKSKISVLPQGVDMRANSLAPCGRGQGEGLKVAFTEPSRGMSGAKALLKVDTNNAILRCTQNDSKIAFTLAETLITLGIIGVVVALTLPSVVKHYKAKVLEVAFKKSVSNLYQAYDMTKRELGVENIYQTYVVYDEANGGYDKTSAEFRNAFEKNLKVVGKYKEDFYPIYNYNGTKCTTQNIGSDYPQATKILADGSSYGMWINGDGVETVYIHLSIDTNGPYKGPNKYGHDIFKFDIRQDNKIHPIAMKKLYTDEELENVYWTELAGYPCSVKSKQASNGAGCSYYAMNNINPDDNTKKYWDSLP